MNKMRLSLMVGVMTGTVVLFQNCAKQDFRGQTTTASKVTFDGPETGPNQPTSPDPSVPPVPEIINDFPEQNGSSAFYYRCKNSAQPIKQMGDTVQLDASDVTISGSIVNRTISNARNVTISQVAGGSIRVEKSDSVRISKAGVGEFDITTRALEGISQVGLGLIKINSVELGPISQVAAAISASTHVLRGSLEHASVASCFNVARTQGDVQVQHASGLFMINGTIPSSPLMLPSIKHVSGVLILENVVVDSLEHGAALIILKNSRINRIQHFAARVYMRDSSIGSTNKSAIVTKQF